MTFLSIPRFRRLRGLSISLRATGGRNSLGRITVHHRGGAVGRFHRLLSRFYSFGEIPAYVLRSEYDPTRSVSLLLLAYDNGYLTYALPTFGVFPGSIVVSSALFRPSVGSSFPLGVVPVGSSIHSVESFRGSGSVYVRSAGLSARLLRKVVLRNSSPYALLRLPSAALRLVPLSSFATYGKLAGGRFRYHTLRKAGQSRLLGFRPSVRGVAMNPVDHPHGGGQGKTSGGRPSVSPWGVLTKGKKTRRRRPTRFIVKSVGSLK